MDFLMGQEVKGIAQDIKQGTIKQEADKVMFEKRLLDGLGEEMLEEIRNPDNKKTRRNKKIAKKLNKKKKWATLIENFKHIFMGKGNQT